MTYCIGIKTKEGIIVASDSRTNAGFDNVKAFVGLLAVFPIICNLSCCQYVRSNLLRDLLKSVFIFFDNHNDRTNIKIIQVQKDKKSSPSKSMELF